MMIDRIEAAIELIDRIDAELERNHNGGRDNHCDLCKTLMERRQELSDLAKKRTVEMMKAAAPRN